MHLFWVSTCLWPKYIKKIDRNLRNGKEDKNGHE